MSSALKGVEGIEYVTSSPNPNSTNSSPNQDTLCPNNRTEYFTPDDRAQLELKTNLFLIRKYCT